MHVHPHTIFTPSRICTSVHHRSSPLDTSHEPPLPSHASLRQQTITRHFESDLLTAKVPTPYTTLINRILPHESPSKIQTDC